MKRNCYLFSNFVRTLLLASLAVIAAIPALAQDTTPPVLTGFTFSPTAVDTTTSSATVNVTAQATDNLSGVNYVYMYFLSPSGTQAAGTGMNMISGNDLNGTWTGTATLPGYVEAGTWTVGFVVVSDNVGNNQHYYASDLQTLGFPTQLQVTSNQDVTPPVLTGFTFSPAAVDTTTSSATVNVTAQATDNLSGVNYVYMYFLSPSGTQAAGTGMNMISGNDLNGTWTGTATLPGYVEAGTWTVGFVVVSDNVGNNQHYYASDLQTLGFPTQLVVDTASTTTTVTSSSNPSVFGQSVTFTATVTPQGPGSPTGSVTFSDGSTALGTSALSGGTATFSTATLAIGPHSISAAYSGDTNFLSSTSPVLTETITSSTTATTLASSLNPSTYGRSITLTATVTSGSGTPTGSVTFTDGASTLGTLSLSGGQATLATSALGAGAHSIIATYGGAPGFTGSASSALAQTVNPAGTGLALASSVNPSAYNQSVTFTATITPQFGGQTTGTVTFKDGATVIGSAAVSSNSASFATNALALGTHSVTASYSGDSNFNTSNSGAVSQVVHQATTGTVVASSLNPAYVTQFITFTATVTGQYGGMPTGSVTFKSGSTTLGAATLNSSGQASLTTSFRTAGTRSITAVYAGDLNNHGSTSAALSQAVNKFPTTTTVGSSLNPSFVGQSVTFTATVSSTYGSIPNGENVTFKDGTAVLATVSLIGGTASYTASSLAAGSHTITASYSADPLFQTSSGTFKQTVKKNPSSAAVVSNLNPSTYGQAVTFTASVTGSVGTPTGTVTFKNGTAVLGTASLSSGTASLTTSTLSAGTKSITVVYNGNSTYAGSTSPALSQKVNKAPTGTSISSSSNPSTSGQSVTFNVTVSSATATPSGTVTFKSGATLLGTGTLNGSGVATFTTSTLAVGSDSITANYGGNSNFVASSASMTQVVNP